MTIQAWFAITVMLLLSLTMLAIAVRSPLLFFGWVTL
jgi:hypothetical protein